MISKIIGGSTYKLPGGLTHFQEDMYVHLINWKWKHISKAPGVNKYKGRTIKYDAILPISYKGKYSIIYPSIVGDLKLHLRRYYFKHHVHFDHMASSQAANINLFLPILLSQRVNDILRLVKTDFCKIATAELYKGFRIEYWDSISGPGLLGDHSWRSGTDSDIAIAYYNHDDELCLWLVEHKLTEKEFTECGGYKSKGKTTTHDCSRSFSDILRHKNYCYYHDIRHREYWNITKRNRAFFANNKIFSDCPFKGGMNQLWRNQLLGLGLENSGAYKHVYFSVVRHPDNPHLSKSLLAYKALVNDNPKFSVLTSLDIINTAKTLRYPDIDKWIQWFKDLYNL